MRGLFFALSGPERGVLKEVYASFLIYILPPRAVSLLPSASKEGVVLSEFHRYRGISSCLREWIDTAAGLIYTMHRLDYSWDIILHYVRMYVEANTPLYPGTSRTPDSYIVDPKRCNF